MSRNRKRSYKHRLTNTQAMSMIGPSAKPRPEPIPRQTISREEKREAEFWMGQHLTMDWEQLKLLCDVPSKLSWAQKRR